MLSLRLVLDTNVIVSAVMSPSGLPAEVLRFALVPPSHLFVSGPVLEEYEGVLERPKFGLSNEDRIRLLEAIRSRGQFVVSNHRLYVCTDQDDNVFLECADAAKADYLVTGNVKHFPLFWKGTKVIRPRELVGLVSPHML